MFSEISYKNKKVHCFFQISSSGASGIALRKDVISRYNLSFNESLGSPNFFNREDFVFLHDLVMKKTTMYTSSTKIIKLLPGVNKFSYFCGYNKQFLESIGGIQYYLHRFYTLYIMLKERFIILKSATKVLFL